MRFSLHRLVTLRSAATSLVLAAHATQAAPAPPAGQIDHTPPQLVQFGVSGAIDAQKPGQLLTAKIVLQDDLSGIIDYGLTLTSPSGVQHIRLGRYTPARFRSIDVNVNFGPGWPDGLEPQFMEPGTWVVDEFLVNDAAGNGSAYDYSQLSALGRATVVVTNAGGYDAVPPALAGGHVDTPVVSLSVPPRGLPAGTPPIAYAAISTTDSGQGIVAGTYEGFVHFSLADGSDGFTLSAPTYRAGQTTNTFTISGPLHTDQSLGVYHMDWAQLVDYAQNSIYVDSNANFPDTITVQP